MYTGIQKVAIAIIPLLFAITLHEAAHGWVANKLGDKTALMLGRVSLNPLRHIDLFGTIILPIIMLLVGGFIFGWAKPVPINWRNLHNPRRDMAFVAIAGPLANLLMALFWAIIAKISSIFFGGETNQTLRTLALFIHVTSLFGISINVFLLVLNLIPIPPLDGSRVVSSLLPPSLASSYAKIEPYGVWIVLALLVGSIWIFGERALLPVFYIISLIKGIFGIP
jgi:Zn-dependent protease